ncbi:MAG: biotin--[Firmicutes bacterium]|nr:biotin--[acetyl-CoA-carboxylase] ligase [Bacillota bacterium]
MNKTAVTKDIIHFSSLDSTNEWLKREDVPAGTIVRADMQTHGRGRGDHSFASPEGGLYFSCLLKGLSGEVSMLLTPKAAASVCMALEEECGLKPSIKWVNDILIDGKKVCGILCEHVGNKYIVGIGINTSTELLPEELKTTAGGIGNVSKDALIEKIADILFAPMAKDVLLAEYSRRLGTLGKKVSFLYEGTEMTGTVKGINEYCNLIIETDDAFVTLSSGEIKLI